MPLTGNLTQMSKASGTILTWVKDSTGVTIGGGGEFAFQSSMGTCTLLPIHATCTQRCFGSPRILKGIILLISCSDM